MSDNDNRKAFEDWHLHQYGIIPTGKEWFMYYAGEKAATEQSSKEIERLNKLVAMQAEALKHARTWLHAAYDFPPQTPECAAMLTLLDASNTKATAEAYDREHAAKVLEEAANMAYTWPDDQYAELKLRDMAAEKRATKQVKE